MHDLQLEFSASAIVGSGHDMIAPFRLSGRLRADGTVEIVKQYVDRHTVFYVGQYDGEGTFHGTWDINGYQGLWSIKVVGLTESDADEHDEIGS
jgi:hypothetical protein